VIPVDALWCSNVMCDNVLNFRSLNSYVSYITDACISLAESTMPHTCSRSNKGRIRWSEHVKPLRDKSLF